jgi:hypothetical protein
MKCRERESLSSEATKTLQTLSGIIQEQIEALQVGDQKKLLSLDKSLELTFGDKERAFGALQQHTKEHGC